MSLLNKNWHLKNTGSSDILTKLLENRGYERAQDLDRLEDFHDPYLFADMRRVVERIRRAVEEGERIIIFGDYDVDGISGTAILAHALKKIGAQFSYRLPNREDGYGLSLKFIDEFIEKQVKLLLTVDCGISCAREVAHAKSAGLDTIITDHHTVPPEIPQAYAILHPKTADCAYPFSELTGAGVAFKLACALLDNDKNFRDELLDLACLGTIADMGELKDENRLIVKRGLQKLSHTTKPGLQTLKRHAGLDGKNVSAGNVGFQLAPRINAAGRIGDPYQALFLILQEQHGPKTEGFGLALEQYNERRRQLTDQAFHEALSNLGQQSIIIQTNPDWPAGILGLIAGKISEQTGKPAFILQEKPDGYVGSARCPDFFNVTAALAHAKAHLTSFGGHVQAAGFSLPKENYQLFTEALHSYAASAITTKPLPTLEIDCLIQAAEITFQTLDLLKQLEPFGIGNSEPTFLLEKITIQDLKVLGQDQKHLKLQLANGREPLSAIAFNFAQFQSALPVGREIDLVCRLNENVWNGQSTLQLEVVDIRTANLVD